MNCIVYFLDCQSQTSLLGSSLFFEQSEQATSDQGTTVLTGGGELTEL